ncbi:MAG: lytic transglycosylase domain-containing protein [Armatimonadota bacterium]|nr:lytic transglycosylase domain-containing protein [Armatimonadota bacterium]
MLSRLPQIIQRVATIRSRLQRVAGVHNTPRPAQESGFAQALAAARRSDAAVAAGHGPFDDIIRHAAESYGLGEDLLHAVIQAESGYNPRCTSSAGAVGLMQLMPGTARALGVSDAYDPVQNVLGGARYLREQLDRFGDLSLALAAYNAGPGAVQRHGGIPPYRETQGYVRRVLRYLRESGWKPDLRGREEAGWKPDSSGREAVP